MAQNDNDWVHHKQVFLWIAEATGALLLIPLVAMQVSPEVDWSAADFVVMGLLLFGAGCLFVLIARRTSRKRRVLIGGAFVIAILYVWAELAVGVLTNFGT